MKGAIAIFGGSFDPPHKGHAEVIRHVAALPDIREIFIIPTHTHPFGKKLAPFSERLDLCLALLKDLGPLDSQVSVLDVEQHLPKPNRTVDTLRCLHEQSPEDAFVLLLGADLEEQFPTWKDAAEIRRLAKIRYLPRQGYPRPKDWPASAPATVAPDVSATQIRERLACGRDVSDLVTPEVHRRLVESKTYGP